MSLQTIEAGRASQAYQFVKEVIEECEALQEQEKGSYAGAYKSYVKKIPMLIKTNGLGATYAFVLSKAKDEKNKKDYAYQVLHTQTLDWLKSRYKKHLLAGFETQHENLPGILINLPSAQYRAVTVEVIALFNWLRRFAEGLIKEEADQD